MSTVAWSKPNPYPKPQFCWLFKLPPKSEITLKRDIPVKPGLNGSRFLRALFVINTAPRQYLRGNTWVLANFAPQVQGTPVPEVVPKKTKMTVTEIIAVNPPIKNCVRVNVDNKYISSFDLCTDVFTLTDLRVNDFTEVGKPFYKLEMYDKKTKTCWIPDVGIGGENPSEETSDADDTTEYFSAD